MRQRLTMFLLIFAVAIPAAAQPTDDYRVAPDKRYLLGPDGKPFFWLGDTAWALWAMGNSSDGDSAANRM